MTRDELEIFVKAGRNIFYFSQFIKIIHPIHGKVPFKLYDFQKRVLWEFINNRFNITLKARQMGLTELIGLYVLWVALFGINKNIVIISLKDRVAKRFLRRIKHMYMNLPKCLQVPIINGRKGEYGTSDEMMFSNGSIITSIPTTEDAGRSEAVSVLVMDEVAIMKYADIIWAAAAGTLFTGGSAILNSCVTGDTEIIGRDGPFRIDSVCPKEFGKKDISKLNLQVLSHTGKWQRVLGAVNKGLLETWEITNDRGDTLKCTPDHKLLTSRGWLPVKEIIEKGYNAIFYDAGLEELEDTRTTIPPEKEIIKDIDGYPNYKVSNLGKIYISKNGQLTEKKSRPTGRKNAEGRDYHSISLWANSQKKKLAIHNLVVKTFIGDIPDGYVVDHINNNPEDNYITNLEIVSISENGKRAAKHSYKMKLSGKTGHRFPKLQALAYAKEKYKEYGKSYGILNIIEEECLEEFGEVLNRQQLSRLFSGLRYNNVHLSKLTLKKKYLDTIYDISVEEDESYITSSKYVSHNTPYGIGNFYHQQWVDALVHTGPNTFNPVQIPWHLHPDRDIEWYKANKQLLGPRRAAQEIDCDFLTSGDTVFDLTDIKALQDGQMDNPILRKELDGRLLIFKEPDPDEEYFIGIDVSTGRARDYSAFSVMNKQGFECAAFKGRVPINKLKVIAGDTGQKYNYAKLAPESNDIGEALTAGLQEMAYPNLFYTQKMLVKRGENNPEIIQVPGWYTTSKNRAIIIDTLERDIREETVTINDPFFIAEAYTFIYDESNRPVAMNKGEYLGDGSNTYSDDAIMSKCITNWVRKGKSNSITTSPY